MIKKILITTGDLKGVGLEVTLKALSRIKEPKHSYVFFAHPESLNQHQCLNIEVNFERVQDFNSINTPGFYAYVDNNKSPFDWFKDSIDHAFLNRHLSAVVTGPLSKQHFNNKNILGHTSYLESRFPNYELFMTFFGSVYNCLLLTDHLPLKKVSSSITEAKITKAINILTKYNSLFNDNKPIALLGLNPHAGENNLIGDEESSVHSQVVKKFSTVVGPMPGDGFFSVEEYKKYSFVVANYHDQGLIPFKVLNGFTACQTTLGLPFVRTSVCHGTAYDKFLKNTASEESMIRAIELAENLLLDKPLSH